MKAISIVLVIVLIGAATLAQNLDSHESKIQHCKVGLLLGHCTIHSGDCKERSQNDNIARLDKRSNTRIRKALNFKTKYTKAKLA